MEIKELLKRAREDDLLTRSELVQMLSYPPDSPETYQIMAEANHLSRQLTQNKAEVYLRLIYFPFTPMNFGIAGTFIITFFVGTIKEIWAEGDWSKLWSFKVAFSVALFVFSLFIPKIIKKVKKEEPHADLRV